MSSPEETLKSAYEVAGGVPILGIPFQQAKTVYDYTDRKMNPDLPKIVEPTVIPLPDDEVQMKTRRRELAANMQRGGYQSTILSTKNKLG